MKVGFIGLGTMGGGMAFNARQGGNEMVVHDIRRESATRHLEAGAVWADSPREVAEASEIVFTSLPGPVEVEAVALGDDGIFQGMSEGKVYFDLSTSTPGLIRRIHEQAAAGNPRAGCAGQRRPTGRRERTPGHLGGRRQGGL